MNDLAAVVIPKSVDNTFIFDKDRNPRLALLPLCDPLPKSSHDIAKNRSDCNENDNGIDNNKADLEDHNKEPRPIKKRKRLALSPDSSMYKKHKHDLPRRSTRRYERSPKSYSLPD